jgi:hypothetical protein
MTPACAKEVVRRGLLGAPAVGISDVHLLALASELALGLFIRRRSSIVSQRVASCTRPASSLGAE